MNIRENVENGREKDILEATLTKLATMMDQLPDHKARDAASLAHQIRQITERISVLDAATAQTGSVERDEVEEMRQRKNQAS